MFTLEKYLIIASIVLVPMCSLYAAAHDPARNKLGEAHRILCEMHNSLRELEALSKVRETHMWAPIKAITQEALARSDQEFKKAVSKGAGYCGGIFFVGQYVKEELAKQEIDPIRYQALNLFVDIQGITTAEKLMRTMQKAERRAEGIDRYIAEEIAQLYARKHAAINILDRDRQKKEQREVREESLAKRRRID